MQSVPFENSAETLDMLRMATDTACVGIWNRDFLSGKVHWSARFREILGIGPEVLSSYQVLLDLVHSDDHNRFTEAVKVATDGAGTGQFELSYRICRPSGNLRWVNARGKCFFEERDGSRKPTRFIGVLLDLTEQKLAQHAVLQAERFAATGRLAASIAHEINNPLEAVTNLLYLLRTTENEVERQGYIVQAEAELARVTEITTNTLRFHRDPIGVTDVPLLGLMQSVLSLYSGRIQVNHVSVQMEMNDVHVPAAQGELRQVLANLVGNALDAMPPGGRLRIRCRRFDHTIGHLRTGVGICIADTGHGMSAEVIKRIFDPFYTTKGSAGSGIGLWLSAELMNNRGYRIIVKSKIDQGTTFALYLPDNAKEAVAA